VDSTLEKNLVVGEGGGNNRKEKEKRKRKENGGPFLSWGVPRKGERGVRVTNGRREKGG